MLAALEVELVNDATDVWVVLGVIATFLAVLVALFGPFLVEWRRRPKLTVVPEAIHLDAWLAEQTGDEGGPVVFVSVQNHRGSRQASDVQVFLSMGLQQQFGKAKGVVNVAYQTPVAFVHQEGGMWTRQFSVAIPPGFARPLQLLKVAGGQLVLANVPDANARPLSSGRYNVVLDVVGSNFSVFRYRGELEVRGVREDQTLDDDAGATWVSPLRKEKYTVGRLHLS